jgi:hypothetical protein
VEVVLGILNGVEAVVLVSWARELPVRAAADEEPFGLIVGNWKRFHDGR